MEKEEVDRIAKGETTESSIDVWPSFEQYKGDYQLIHDNSTDADVILLADNEQVWVLSFKITFFVPSRQSITKSGKKRYNLTHLTIFF